APGAATTAPAAGAAVAPALRFVELTAPARKLAGGHTKGVSSAAFDPSSSRLATGSGDLTVVIWDAADGRPLLSLPGHAKGVPCVAWGRDGRRLASGDHDGAIRIWDASSGQLLKTLANPGGGGVDELAFVSDSTLVSKDFMASELRVWDLDSEGAPLTVPSSQKGLISLALSGDRGLAAVAGERGVEVFQTQDWKPVAQFEMAEARSVSLDAAGGRVAAGDGAGTVTVWDLATRSRVWTHAGSVMVPQIAFSTDGRWLAATTPHNAVSLWQAASGQLVGQLTGFQRSFPKIDWSGDGRWLVTAVYESTGEAQLWDAAQWQAGPPPAQAPTAGAAHSQDEIALAGRPFPAGRGKPLAELSKPVQREARRLGYGDGDTVWFRLAGDEIVPASEAGDGPDFSIWGVRLAINQQTGATSGFAVAVSRLPLSEAVQRAALAAGYQTGDEVQFQLDEERQVMRILPKESIPP
ncbi:MAG TPA: WD40 repeat domain-containing protein, partial [Thermoanaerobaculia bacterium]|nr:WD40 repeat domain-containing protein [Thermoanaerobaculia bacterium]